MPRLNPIDANAVLRAIAATGPLGASPESLESALMDASRATLNRRLRELVVSGQVAMRGRGRSTRYFSKAPYSVDDVRRYFETEWQSRPSVGFREELLLPSPGLDLDAAARLRQIQKLSRPLDRKFLSDFLIDFSWASSVLEGSTYSNIDTEALIRYGAKNPDKPMEDAVLILNHKNAIEYLWHHRELSTTTLCEVQSRLTDRHGVAELENSDHFLPDAQRGIVREYEDVRLGRSAYGPPFRPGTGYIRDALVSTIETASSMNPVAAAFHLVTRIPYLQAFANGNKRTSRLAANLPLLGANLLPLSFVDFAKAEYVLGMSAFYELGDVQLMEHVFVDGYVRSVVRGSDIPASVRARGFSVGEVAVALAEFVRSGRPPHHPIAAMFLR